MRFDVADDALQIAVAHQEFVVRFFRHDFQHGIAAVVFIEIGDVFARAHCGSYRARLHVENIFNQVVFLLLQHASLRARIDDAAAKLVITADGGYRRGAASALKPAVDEALAARPGLRGRLGEKIRQAADLAAPGGPVVSAAARLPRRAWLMVIVAGFLGFCAVLRAPVGVIPPLLTRLGQDLGMGEVARGALTSVPILCFGLLTPLASMVVRRVGINTAGLLTLGMALAGALLRSAGTTWAAFHAGITPRLMPATTEAPVWKSEPHAASAHSSRNGDSRSRIMSIRSRAVFFPRECWRSTGAWPVGSHEDSRRA